MTDQYVSLRQYSRQRGVSLYAVQTAVASGRVTAVRRDPDGKITGIDPAAADAQWAAHTDATEAAKSGADPFRGAVVQPDLVDRAAVVVEAVPASGLSDTAEYQASRAKREQYQAELARLDLLGKLGQLGSVEGFVSAVTDAAQLAQDRILQVPSRISTSLAVETDPIKIETLLTRELKDALDGIAQRAAELAKPAGGTG
jgi:hypothetical protein